MQFQLRAETFAEAAAQLVEDLAGGLRVDFIRELYAGAKVRPLGTLRPAERVERRILCSSEARWHLAHHLLGHRLSALAQLLKRARLLAGRFTEVTIP